MARSRDLDRRNFVKKTKRNRANRTRKKTHGSRARRADDVGNGRVVGNEGRGDSPELPLDENPRDYEGRRRR